MRKLCFSFLLIITFTFQTFSQNHQSDYLSVENSFKQEFEKSFFKIVVDSYLLDSVITETLQGSKGKSAFAYDEKGRAVQHKMFDSYKSEWTPTWDITIEYNDNDKITSIFHKFWDNVIWKNFDLETREYDEKGRLLLTISQSWNSDVWENRRRSEYSYDEDNNLATETSQNWNDGEWENTFRFTKSFIGNSELLDQMLIETWDGKEWTKSFLSTSIYDADGNLVEAIGQMWENGAWVDIYKILYKEGNDKEKFIIYQTFNGSEWQNGERTTMFYDDNDLLTKIFCEIWENEEWQPDNGAVTIQLPYGYTYGHFGVNSASFYYHSVTGVEVENQFPETFLLKQNYPNPFSKGSGENSSTTIEYTIPIVVAANFASPTANVTLKIYDVLGHEIATLVDEEQPPGNYSVQFSANALSAGVYFYRLQTGNFMQTKKMLILK